MFPKVVLLLATLRTALGVTFTAMPDQELSVNAADITIWCTAGANGDNVFGKNATDVPNNGDLTDLEAKGKYWSTNGQGMMLVDHGLTGANDEKLYMNTANTASGTVVAGVFKTAPQKPAAAATVHHKAALLNDADSTPYVFYIHGDATAGAIPAGASGAGKIHLFACVAVDRDISERDHDVDPASASQGSVMQGTITHVTQPGDVAGSSANGAIYKVSIDSAAACANTNKLFWVGGGAAATGDPSATQVLLGVVKTTPDTITPSTNIYFSDVLDEETNGVNRLIGGTNHTYETSATNPGNGMHLVACSDQTTALKADGSSIVGVAVTTDSTTDHTLKHVLYNTKKMSLGMLDPTNCTNGANVVVSLDAGVTWAKVGLVRGPLFVENTTRELNTHFFDLAVMTQYNIENQTNVPKAYAICSDDMTSSTVVSGATEMTGNINMGDPGATNNEFVFTAAAATECVGGAKVYLGWTKTGTEAWKSFTQIGVAVASPKKPSEHAFDIPLTATTVRFQPASDLPAGKALFACTLADGAMATSGEIESVDFSGDLFIMFEGTISGHATQVVTFDDNFLTLGCANTNVLRFMTGSNAADGADMGNVKLGQVLTTVTTITAGTLTVVSNDLASVAAITGDAGDYDWLVGCSADKTTIPTTILTSTSDIHATADQTVQTIEFSEPIMFSDRTNCVNGKVLIGSLDGGTTWEIIASTIAAQPAILTTDSGEDTTQVAAGLVDPTATAFEVAVTVTAPTDCDYIWTSTNAKYTALPEASCGSSAWCCKSSSSCVNGTCSAPAVYVWKIGCTASFSASTAPSTLHTVNSAVNAEGVYTVTLNAALATTDASACIAGNILSGSLDNGTTWVAIATLGSCLTSSECPASDYCHATTNVCTTLVVAGGACVATSDCVSGPTCISNVCTLGTGDGCTAGSTDECAVADYCKTGTNICTTYTTGDACTAGSTNQCPASDYCITGTNVCTTLVVAGGACVATSDCVSGPTCISNVCTLATGDACTNGSTNECPVTDYCHATDNVCTTLIVAGAQCVATSDCVSGATCIANVCILATGGACTAGSTNECPSTDYCKAGTNICTAYTTGDACTAGSTDECPSTDYCHATDNVCTTLVPAGGACVASTDCVSGTACVEDICTRATGDACTAGSTDECPVTDYCHATDDVCTTYVEITGSCADKSECLPPLDCIAGKCDTAAALGSNLGWGIFVCILFCCFCIWYKRKQDEDEKKENQQAVVEAEA